MPKTKYTYDYCKEYVKKFTSLKELRRENNSIYVTIIKRGWEELLVNLPKYDGDYLRVLYSYEFKEYNSVYIGLTYDIKKRNIDHHRKGTVFNFAIEHNISDFTPKILENNVEYYNAGKKEEYYINFYKTNGWNILNKSKPGSLGSPMHEKEREICCFDSDGKLILICNKKNACEKFNIKYTNLMIALRNFNRMCNGYRFLYKDVWENKTEKELNKKRLHNEIEKIAILDKNLNLIKICDSKNDAKTYCGTKSSNNNIVSLKHFQILNSNKTFKCCYYSDYVKYLNNEYTICFPNIPKCKKIVFVPNNIEDKEKFINKIVENPNWEKNRLLKRRKRK